jgi:hypothetical protein
MVANGGEKNASMLLNIDFSQVKVDRENGMAPGDKREGQVHRFYLFYLKALYRVLVGKPEGKRLLRRSRRRWENNIKMDLQAVGREGKGRIDLVQNVDE